MAIDLTKVSVATSMRGGNLVATRMTQGAGAPAVPDAYLQYAESSSNTSPYTFSTQNLGTADASRIIICLALAPSGAISSTGVTLDGNTMTRAVGISTMGIFYLAWPTGTTGTFVVTSTFSPTSCMIALYSIFPTATVALDSASTSTASGNSLSNADVQIVVGGRLFGFCYQHSVNQTFTKSWTGVDAVTWDAERLVGDSGARVIYGHIFGTTEAQTTTDLNFSWTSGDTARTCCASWDV